MLSLLHFNTKTSTLLFVDFSPSPNFLPVSAKCRGAWRSITINRGCNKAPSTPHLSGKSHDTEHNGEEKSKSSQGAITETKTGTKTDRVKMKSETAKNTNAIRQLGTLSKEKNDIIWESFPTWGGVFPNPKTFVNLPSIFLYAKFILRC